jgi:hypothetical protein
LANDVVQVHYEAQIELINVDLWDPFTCYAFLDLRMGKGDVALLLVAVFTIIESSYDVKCGRYGDTIDFHKPRATSTGSP